MKKINYFILIMLITLPLNVLASGLKISSQSISLEENKEVNITLTSDNIVGPIDIISNDTSIATVSDSKIWIENSGSDMTKTITIKGLVPGTTTLTLTADCSTMDPGNEQAYQKTFTVNVTVTKTKSSNNRLSELLINGNKVSDFDYSQTSFNLGSTDDDSIRVEGVTEDGNATVTGNGIIELDYGSNTFKLVVKAENGSTKTYTFYVNRNDYRDNDSTLKNLEVSSGKINFKATTKTYTIKLDEKVETFTVKGTLNSSKQRIGYSPSNKVTLKVGETKTITIKVIAENGSYTCYKVKVTRGEAVVEEETDTTKKVTLKDLYIPNYVIDYDENISNYSINVPNNINSLDISYDTNYADDNVEIIGNSNFEEGDNFIEVTVSNDSGSKTYNIKVVKEGLIENKIEDNTTLYIIIICLLIVIIILLLGVIYLKTDIFKKKTNE